MISTRIVFSWETGFSKTWQGEAEWGIKWVVSNEDPGRPWVKGRREAGGLLPVAACMALGLGRWDTVGQGLCWVCSPEQGRGRAGGL